MNGRRRFVGLLLVCSWTAGCGVPEAVEVKSDPTNVVIAQPTFREVTDYEEFTGHTDAILSVQVRARVTGYLLKRVFQEGAEVHQGDLLYEIDDRPYKAALDSAEAAVALNEAHRNRLEADHKRASNLFQRGAIGKQEFDLINGDFAEAEAAVGVSQAQLDVARLNMSFTKVRAPMDGQISRTLVDPGNLIRQDDTILTDIVAADRLYVYFDLNDEAMRRVQGLIDQGRVEKGPGKEVPVLVGLSDEEEFPYKGLVNFSENKLDAATGTLRVRGEIVNPRPWVLSPGLFVRVRLPIGAPHPAVLVAEDAVGSDQGRRFVYVVNPDDEVVYRPVDVGPTYGSMRAIRNGLSRGDRIIVNAEGLRRVRPGSKVAPKLAPLKGGVGTSPLKTASRGTAIH